MRSEEDARLRSTISQLGKPLATSTFRFCLETYLPGDLLFSEREDPRGVFTLCDGEVKVSLGSSSGKTLTLRIACAGEMLGMTAVLSGKPYEGTAEVVSQCEVAFVRSCDFVNFIGKYPEAYQGVAKQLGELYSGTCERLRTVCLATTVTGKLASLLLDWSAETKNTELGSSFKLQLTHEEIAEFIGTTRETVTRTLIKFKNEQLVALHGSTLTISNRPALKAIGCQ